jgi:hypothetical protein
VVRRRRAGRERFRTCSWYLRARISRCNAARDRTSDRSDRSTETTKGIIDRRPFDGAENLNDAARTGFLVGTGPPAGLLLDAQFDQEQIRLVVGDVCLLVTDGVTEALDGDMPLEGDIVTSLSRYRPSSAGDSVRR